MKQPINPNIDKSRKQIEVDTQFCPRIIVVGRLRLKSTPDGKRGGKSARDGSGDQIRVEVYVYVGLSIIWGLIEKSTLEKLDRSNNMASVLL